MEDKLIKSLESLGISVYNLIRPEEINECIVYRYSEEPFSTCDNDEDVIKYTIYLNLYCVSGLNRWKKSIKKVLKDNGFYVSQVPMAVVEDDSKMINQAFRYTYVESIII